MTESRSTRLRPANSLLVTRARQPAEIRTGYATVPLAEPRGYTGMVDALPAASVVPLLDEFFRVLDTAAKKYAGKVYYMAGDGIMAGFGGTRESGGGAAEALAAGQAMLDRFAPVARRWRRAR